MQEKTAVTEIAPGTILPGARQFIERVRVQAPTDVIDVRIPGQVLRCGGEHGFSILPYAYIFEKSGPITRSALLTADVVDDRGLDREMTRLGETLYSKAITGYAIRLTSRESFGAALDAADKGGGCGCQGGKTASVHGTISVGIRHDRDFAWTEPVHARLLVLPKGFFWYGPEDGWFYFTCHSVWFGWIDRSTSCEGPCTAPLECRCDNLGEGKKLFNCPKWRVCICK